MQPQLITPQALVTTPCQHCNKPILTKPYRIADGRAKFCGKPCQKAASRKTTLDIDHITARFWAKVEKTDTCWLWRGPLLKTGYGSFNIKPKTHRAHRIAWLLTNGPIPDGVDVCHTCDVRPCVRPAHLWLGTRAENLQDASNKGRMAKPNAKLTAIQAQTILNRYAAGGITLLALANEYGVALTTVHHIIRRRTWKRLKVQSAS